MFVDQALQAENDLGVETAAVFFRLAVNPAFNSLRKPNPHLCIFAAHCTSYDAHRVIEIDAECVIPVKRKVRHICGMTKNDPHFRLRLPADLKSRVGQSAEKNNRSINAEIVHRLEASFVFQPVRDMTAREVIIQQHQRERVAEQIAQDEALLEFVPDPAKREHLRRRILEQKAELEFVLGGKK